MKKFISFTTIALLLDQIINQLDLQDEETNEDEISFSIIGRPNVGKSSLTNAILGEERVIVSNIEGTTRDAIDTPFVKDGQKYRVVDTAGMRKKGKVYENIEKYSILRALTSIEKVMLFLLLLMVKQELENKISMLLDMPMKQVKALSLFIISGT